MLALSLQKRGVETYVFFENDFSINNQGNQKLRVHAFEGSFNDDQIYLSHFKTTQEKIVELNISDVIHMRLDPPFDSRYLRILWMLDHLVSIGIKVMNDPRGIMQFNEKLFAYRSQGATASYVGQNLKLAEDFVEQLNPKPLSLILKPMDLYSGIGVEKLSLDQWRGRFKEKVVELQGPVILQPFVEAVMQGEVRSIFFKGQEIGTILKTPKNGEFLSNIAQGATFHATELSELAKSRAHSIVQELSKYGVDWVAFDILSDAISEVNITCPGLLVEVSYAHKKNLADVLIDLFI